MRDWAGKVAFVTGSASGIGLAMARSFSAVGMKVAIADIEEQALAQAQAYFAPSNAEAIALRVDVTGRDAMARADDETERTFGKVHVVCNNVAVVGLSETMRAELAARNIGVSVLCPGFVNTNIFTSERNRPGALRTQPDSDPQPMNLEAYAEFLDSMLDPSIVGDMTLHAIQHDEAYIFPHPEIALRVSSRLAEIEASCARWRQYRERRGIPG